MTIVKQETGSPVRIGLVGCGVIGRQHLEGARAVPELARIVAAADLSEAARERVRADFGIERLHADASALIAEPDVEAVILALPTSIRGPLAIEAMRRGKHVLIEKPVAATAADLEPLLSERAGLVVAVCSSRFRFTKLAEEARDLIASGRIGTLREIRLRGHRAAPPRPETMPPAWRLSRAQNGGGILWNWGPYDFDFALGLNGWSLEPSKVLGQTWPIAEEIAGWVPPHSDAETHGVALVRFSSGAVLTIDRGEYLSGPTGADCQFIGTHGALSIDMAGGKAASLVLFELGPDGARETLRRQSDEGYDAIPPRLIADFARAVRGLAPPMTSLDQALTVVRITEAIRSSAETADIVSLT